MAADDEMVVNLQAEDVCRLDDLPGELCITAERLSGDGNHILYQFAVDHAGRYLLEGRAAVILDAEANRESPP